MDTLLRGTAEEFSASGVLQTLLASMKGRRLAVHIYGDEEMDETDYILSDPVHREKLLKTVEEINRGEGLKKYTIEELQQKFNVPEA